MRCFAVMSWDLGNVFALFDDVFVFEVRGQFDQVNRLGVEPLADGVWKGAALTGDHVLDGVAQNEEAAVAVARLPGERAVREVLGHDDHIASAGADIVDARGTVSAT